MFCKAVAAQLWAADTSKVVIVDVKDLHRPCRLRLTDPITPKGVIGGDIHASSNGKTLIHRRLENTQPWVRTRTKLTPKRHATAL